MAVVVGAAEPWRALDAGSLLVIRNLQSLKLVTDLNDASTMIGTKSLPGFGPKGLPGFRPDAITMHGPKAPPGLHKVHDLRAKRAVVLSDEAAAV